MLTQWMRSEIILHSASHTRLIRCLTQVLEKTLSQPSSVGVRGGFEEQGLSGLPGQCSLVIDKIDLGTLFKGLEGAARATGLITRIVSHCTRS